MKKLILTIIMSSIIMLGLLNLSTVSSINLNDTDLVWYIENVDSERDVGKSSDLVLDSNGSPNIAYSDNENDRVKFAKWNGGTWDIETVGTYNDNARIRVLSLALDQYDNPHICFELQSTKNIIYASKSSGAWQTVEVGSGSLGGPDIAVDSNGGVHISYWDMYEGLKYAMWNGVDWSYEDVDSVLVGLSDIIIDNGGNPHISYFDETNEDIKYASRKSGAWVSWTVDTVNCVGERNSISLDSTGNAHIAYQHKRLEGTTWQDFSVQYATGSGIKWDIKTVDTNGITLAGDGIDIDMDSKDRPHICYNVWESSFEFILKYTKWTGSGWDRVTVDPDQTGSWSIALAIDDQDNSHVSYFTEDDYRLKYAKGIKPVPPAPPKNLLITEDDSSLELSWEAPDDIGSTTITEYVIYKSSSSGSKPKFKTVSPASKIYKDTLVVNGNKYYYHVTSINEFGESEASDEISGVPKGVPSQPLNLKATPKTGEISLTWEKPNNNGGAKISQYKIYRGTDIENIFFLSTVNGNIREYTDEDVESDQNYIYQITAVNDRGESQKSFELTTSPKKVKSDESSLDKSMVTEAWFLIVILVVAVVIVIVIFSVMRKRRSAYPPYKTPTQARVSPPAPQPQAPQAPLAAQVKPTPQTQSTQVPKVIQAKPVSQTYKPLSQPPPLTPGQVISDHSPPPEPQGPITAPQNCTKCGSALQFHLSSGSWYCEKCKKYY
jgi:hypothetical protein